MRILQYHTVYVHNKPQNAFVPVRQVFWGGREMSEKHEDGEEVAESWNAYSYFALILAALSLLGIVGAFVEKINFLSEWISDHWEIGFFSALFPLLALGFAFTRVKVRRNEIVQELSRDGLWIIYAKSWKITNEDNDVKSESDVRGSPKSFRSQVDERINEQYNFVEFMGASFFAGLVCWLLSSFSMDVITDGIKLQDSYQLLQEALPAAFLGSYVGGLLFLIKKFVTADLRPASFLQVGGILIAGSLTGAFVGTFDGGSNYSSAMAFFFGLVAALQTDFVHEFAKSQVNKLAKFKRVTDSVVPDLHKVVQNPELLDALNRLSIYTVRELARTDPMRLYFYVAKDHSVIVDLIDQAILHAEFPEMSDQLIAQNVTSFSNLVQRYDPVKLSDWAHDDAALVRVVDNGGPIDGSLLSTCRSLFMSGNYHGILGLTLYRYRNFHYENKGPPGSRKIESDTRSMTLSQ